MKCVKKLLAAFIMLILVTSVCTADQNGSNLSENKNLTSVTIENQTKSMITTDQSQNLESNLTPEEIKILKELLNKEKSQEKLLDTTEAMKKAKVPQDIINISTIPIPTKTSNISQEFVNYNPITYYNRISGMQIQGTSFSETIYNTNDYTIWTSWSFYLQENSYAYVEVNGNVNDFWNHKYYIMNIDNSQYTNWAYDDQTCRDTGLWADPKPCKQELQRSKLFYLTKGLHTVNLNGYADRNGDRYSVDGFISVLAFPEYTAITVTSPDGANNWAKGTTKTISWKKDGNPGANVKIELYKGTTISAVISSKTPNDGSYSWFIPPYQPIGTDYKIKITGYEEPKYLDWSNNNFKIY